MSIFAVYLLWNTQTKRTYVGYTNNLDRRLRQHNGEIKGGARHTSHGKGFWTIIDSIGGIPTRSKAMSLEYRLKKGWGKANRLEAFKKAKKIHLVAAEVGSASRSGSL